MIRIVFDESTLARTRIAISPLLEAIRGLELIHRQRDRVPWPYTAWAQQAAEVLRTVPETAPLQLYADLYGANHGRRTPDLFTPIPGTAAPQLADELATLRTTAPKDVRKQFALHYPEGVPEFLMPYQERPQKALAELADGLQVFWDRAMSPYWPTMRIALEEEVLLRARTLAAEGPSSLLENLRGQMVWEPPVLSLTRPKESELIAAGQRLLLVPLIFAQERVACSTDHPEIIMVSYQARGEGVLASQAPVAGGDRLGSLIGAGRARILRALREPATTSGLAAGLGLAPSTVSEQLAALQTAGVVARRRSGRHVLYGLEPAGVALVSLLTP